MLSISNAGLSRPTAFKRGRPCLEKFCTGRTSFSRRSLATYLLTTTYSDNMVSASKAAREAKRAADGKPAKKTAASKLASKNASGASSVNGDETPPLIDADGQELNEDGETVISEQVKKLGLQEDKDGISDRVTTGVLSSLEASRDVKITSASLVFHGKVLFNDTTIEVTYGRRYGLLGENGCGKSTLLKAIDKREFPFPDHIDIYLLNEGAPLSNLGALEWVVKEAENELARLEKLSEDILERDGPDTPVLEELYEVSQDVLSGRMRPGADVIASVWRAWTHQLSKLVPPLFSQVSDSTRPPSTKRPRTCLEVGECEWRWPRRCSSSLLYFSWTTLLHIWISRPACG